MNTSIPRTVKSSSSAAPPSLLSGLTPPPPATSGRQQQQPASKSQSRPQQQAPPPTQPPPPPTQQHHHRQNHVIHNHPTHANDILLRPSYHPSSSFQMNDFQIHNHSSTSAVVPPSQLHQQHHPPIPPPPPLPPLNDAQKKTLRHLDTLVEVVSEKVAEQMEQNKLVNMSFVDTSGSGSGSGLMGSANKRKREMKHQQQQQQQHQGIDSVSSISSELFLRPRVVSCCECVPVACAWNEIQYHLSLLKIRRLVIHPLINQYMR